MNKYPSVSERESEEESGTMATVQRRKSLVTVVSYVCPGLVP